MEWQIIHVFSPRKAKEGYNTNLASVGRCAVEGSASSTNDGWWGHQPWRSVLLGCHYKLQKNESRCEKQNACTAPK